MSLMIQAETIKHLHLIHVSVILQDLRLLNKSNKSLKDFYVLLPNIEKNDYKITLLITEQHNLVFLRNKWQKCIKQKIFQS